MSHSLPSFLESSPSLGADLVIWGLLASSSLPEEMSLLSLELLEGLGWPEGGCCFSGSLGFLSLLVALDWTGMLWGGVTGSVSKALLI